MLCLENSGTILPPTPCAISPVLPFSWQDHSHWRNRRGSQRKQETCWPHGARGSQAGRVARKVGPAFDVSSLRAYSFSTFAWPCLFLNYRTVRPLAEAMQDLPNNCKISMRLFYDADPEDVRILLACWHPGLSIEDDPRCLEKTCFHAAWLHAKALCWCQVCGTLDCWLFTVLVVSCSLTTRQSTLLMPNPWDKTWYSTKGSQKSSASAVQRRFIIALNSGWEILAILKLDILSASLSVTSRIRLDD